MSVNTDVQMDLNLDEIITYMQNKDNVSKKLDKPNGGDVFVCENTNHANIPPFIPKLLIYYLHSITAADLNIRLADLPHYLS